MPPAAVAHAGSVALIPARGTCHGNSLSLGGRFRDDVDDSIDRIRAPQRSARAADDLNLRDVFQRKILCVPIDAAKLRRVHASSVNQHQHLVIDVVAESARADCPPVTIDGGHIKPRHRAQRFCDGTKTTSPDVLRRDHKNGRRRVRETLTLPGRRTDLGLDVHQFFETKVGKVHGFLLLAGGRNRVCRIRIVVLCFAQACKKNKQTNQGEANPDSPTHQELLRREPSFSLASWARNSAPSSFIDRVEDVQECESVFAGAEVPARRYCGNRFPNLVIPKPKAEESAAPWSSRSDIVSASSQASPGCPGLAAATEEARVG